MASQFSQRFRRLLRGGGALFLFFVALKPADAIENIKAFASLVGLEVRVLADVTPEMIAPYAGPAAIIAAIGMAGWTVWPSSFHPLRWFADQLEKSRMVVVTVGIGLLLMMSGAYLTFRGVADIAASAKTSKVLAKTKIPSDTTNSALAARKASPDIGAAKKTIAAPTIRPDAPQDETPPPIAHGLRRAGMPGLSYCTSQPRPFEAYTAAQIQAQVRVLTASLRRAEVDRNAAIRATVPAPGEPLSPEKLKEMQDHQQAVSLRTHEEVISTHLSSIRNIRCEMIARLQRDGESAASDATTHIINAGLIKSPTAISETGAYLDKLADMLR